MSFKVTTKVNDAMLSFPLFLSIFIQDTSECNLQFGVCCPCWLWWHIAQWMLFWKDSTDVKTTSWVMTGRKSSHFNPSFNHVSMNLQIPQTKCQKSRTQTSVVSNQLLESKKADTTNCCSLKKRTIQTFWSLKREHYKFCNEKSRHHQHFWWMA